MSREICAKASVFALDIPEGVTYSLGMGKKKLPAEVQAYFAKEGRKGGLKGGPARAAKMTPEQRSESARKAVLARWNRRETKQKTSPRIPPKTR